MADFEVETENWIQTRNETINMLRKLADELDLMQKKVNTSNIAVSSVSITTGIGSIVCFGLALVTGGISIVPGIVLAVLGGGGAGASALTFRFKHKHEKDLLQKVQISLDTDRRQSERFNITLAELNTSKTGTAGSRIARGGMGVPKSIAGLVDLGAGILTARTVSQVAGAVGFVFDLVILPLDIYFLVDSSIDVHRGSIHEASVEVRTVAEDLERERDTFQELFNVN